MRLQPDNLTESIRYLIILLLLITASPAVCQTDEDPPVSPVFRTVTINQVTGITEMTWSLSPSPDVTGYVVYIFQDGEGYAIDTIPDRTAISYSVLRPGTSYFSESYVIAAIDTAGNISPLSNDLNTIFTASQLDTCNKKILLAWNNYMSVPVIVTGYDVLTSVNGNAYYLAGHTSADVTNLVIDDFINGSAYCFIVKAILENGFASSSNKSCLTARIQTPPQWINADYATVTDFDEIALKFTVDPSSEIDLFGLERKTGRSGTFQQIGQIRTATGSVTFTDKTADLNTINYYRLSAINSCSVSSTSSNLASNMVLSVTSAGNEARLSWNQYQDWLGPVSDYKVFMDTGSGFIEEAQTEPGDTVFSISIPEIMYRIMAGQVCFYIIASENSNPYGITGESSSNRVCMAVDEVITVPNIFTPDGDTKNDLFRPVITFTPSSYRLIISNRQGRVLFESGDFTESWDGTDNGEPVPEGVYLWILKVSTPTGRSISRTGTLTLFKNSR